MFHLKTKDMYRKTIYWFNFVFKFFFLLFLILLFLNTLFIFKVIVVSDKMMKLFTMILIYASLGLSIVNLIIRELIFVKYQKLLVKEYLLVLSKVKMPAKLPKVVYVYTTHNDFMPSRMLQNMQQTYKNIEYWISDGSSDNEISKQIEEFAVKNKVNLFRMSKPSENKADNLNTFLTQSGVKFDYLLIGDADVAFDKNMVNCNIRYFYSENQIRLGYVSSLIQNYKTRNFFSNMLRFIENLTLFKKDINKILKKNYSPNLYSAACLLKKEYLDDLGGFPEGCFEDGYAELNGSKRYWYGLVSPLTLCLQKFDENIKKYHSRQLRIFDWIIKYEKEQGFVNLNNRFKSTYNEYFINVFSGPSIILSILLFPIIILFLIWFWPILLVNKFYWIIILISIIGGWIASSIVNYNSAKIMGMANSFFFPIFQMMLYLSYWPYLVKHWINSFVRKKYSTFKPTWTKTKNKSNKFNLIKWDLLIFVVSISIFTITLTLFLHFKWYLNIDKTFNWAMLFLFVFLSSISGLFVVSFGSLNVLYLLSFIISNKKYSDDEFVKYENDYVKFKQIKNDFFNNHNDIEPFC